MSQYSVENIQVKVIDRESAKACVKTFHYMKTFPSGAKLFFGIFHKGFTGLQGVAVFGKSSGTDAKSKLFPQTEPENIIEMQRLWVSDNLGHNAESKTLSLIMKVIKQKAPSIKVVWTYAGGCKNDCGIVYQSSGFMYLGSEDCKDFWLTDSGEYKNLINVLRFGKAKEKGSIEARAEYIYGKGEIVDAKRHYYFYPIDKILRRKMKSKTKPFPKESANFRKNQEWQ